MLTRKTIGLMAVSVGLIVANIYYIQPLLADIALELHMTSVQAGVTAMLTQIGTAFGMLFFVPLGDLLERRSLISLLLFCETGALVLCATAQDFWWLNIASFLVGLTGATTHLIIPFAANLAPEKERGRIVGTVFSGLLLGILLARTFSGFVGAAFGWRSVYWIAAALMAALALLIRSQLPKSKPSLSLSYGRLMRSLIDLIRDHPALRESAFLGPVFFVVFSTFWTTLIFRLETPPFHYGARTAGLFGLAGAAGALGAPYVGRLADRSGPRKTIGLALIICLISYLWLGFTGGTLTGLALGALFLDLGVQAGHVSNQTRIYALDPDARSRLNTVYMVCYFSGGAIGSFLGAWAWRLAQWHGVCLVSLAAILIAMFFYKRNERRFTPSGSHVRAG